MSNGASPETVQIQESLNGVSLALWGVLVFLFAVPLALGIVGAMMVIAPIAARTAGVSDIGKAIGVLASLNGPRISAFLNSSLVGGGVVVLLGGVAVALLAFFILRSVERLALKRKSVTPLLAGAKMRFIPCEDGLYTHQYRDVFTRSVWYRLRPWNSLVLDALDEKKQRIVVRDGKTTVFLKARRGTAAATERAGYNDLKEVVMSHLPEAGRTPQHRPLRFGWAALAVCVCVLVASTAYGARTLAAHTEGKVGDGRCDICGRSLGFQYVQQMNDGKIVREYCVLHGLAHAVAHPASAIWSAFTEIPADVKQDGFFQGILQNQTSAYAVMTWWIILCVVLAIVVPKPLSLDQ